MVSLSNHHAYLLVGSAENAEKYLHELFNLSGSPDYFVWKGALFGIGEARDLVIAAGRRAFTERKVFLIAPEKFTLEAQNALLKTFEDPIENTHFFLAAREEELIIPTLRSRMQIVNIGQSRALTNGVENFLKLSLKGRLNFAQKFAESEKNLSVFLDELLLLLRNGRAAEPLKRAYNMRRYSDDRSAAPRLILEHLALVLDR